MTDREVAAIRSQLPPGLISRVGFSMGHLVVQLDPSGSGVWIATVCHGTPAKVFVPTKLVDSLVDTLKSAINKIEEEDYEP